ncbi:MAG: hypothetical protein ACI4JF_00520, partial [Oscillospiraceae bacterium]
TGDTTVEAEYTAIEYTVTYVLSADETIELTSQNVAYDTVPETVTLPTVLDIDSDGTYDYYLLDWHQPSERITGDKVISVTYDDYSSVLEVKVSDVGGDVEHYLSKVGNTITLPSTAAERENYTFIGWGYVNSGGYADSSVKEGCTDRADSLLDYLTSYDGTAKFAPGETITLTDSMRSFEGYKNFKFAATYLGNEQTIIFIVDGEEYDRTTVRYGDYLYGYDEVPPKEGYTGVWMYNGDVLDSYHEVTGDMEVVAVYTPTT